MRHDIRIGTAAWTIPGQHAAEFPGKDSHLLRYARRFSAVEINSSFYRPHRPETYARWAATVPPNFRFAVKMPREISHQRRLLDAAEPLARFLNETAALGERLGPLLLQLPPSLRYEPTVADPFLGLLRARFAGAVVCEPRHPSWFTAAAEDALLRFRVARVAADPAPVAGAGQSAGWPALEYRRLHGAPHVYYSAYPAATLDALAPAMRDSPAAETWCIFDNTARGAATADALGLLGRL